MLKFNEDFVKNYDEDSDKGYNLEVNVKYLEDLHDLYSNWPFLPEIIIINKRKKLVCTFCHKKTCCPYKSFKTIIKSWTNIEKST